MVSYVWKVCNETTLPFIDSIFLCSLFTRHHQSISKNNHFNFFLVLDLMNCCKFQKPMTKPIRKRALLNKNYEIKCLNTRWCFTSTKRIYPKWRYLTYCWYWCQKYPEDCSSLSTELLSSVNKNSTILYNYLMLQFKDENKASYFYVQGAR